MSLGWKVFLLPFRPKSQEVIPMQSVTVLSQAKLNLSLAITGKRSDGFHSLVSVVSQVSLHDELTVNLRESGFTLACDNPEVPLDSSNLILKAAALYNELSGYSGGAHFLLKKVIPMGAGLGGGSSNAVAAITALGQLTGKPIDPAILLNRVAELGSDCPLFLSRNLNVMRGRGELITALPNDVQARFKQRQVVIFKPDFGISTAWAYKRMAELNNAYTPSEQAEKHLDLCLNNLSAPIEDLLFNGMQAPAFLKFPSLAIMAEHLKKTFGLKVLMSGSGSACFAILPLKNCPTKEELTRVIQEVLGDTAFVCIAELVC